MNISEKITIIIPMRNEQDFITSCLDSVIKQIHNVYEYEILIVDGLSTDNTRKIVLEYIKKNKNIHLLDNPNMIVPTAMNIAIRKAHGDIIFRLDCHSIYLEYYFKNCIELLHRTGADNVGGYMETLPSKNSKIAQAIRIISTHKFGVGGSAFRIGGLEREVDAVPFGCFRRDVFQRFGMYDERLVRNQDLELNSRIRRKGGKIIISPEIKVVYYTRSTFKGLRQQAFNNGLWNPYTVYLTGGGLRLRHFVPFMFLMSIIIMTLTGFLWKTFWIITIAEILLYLSLGTYYSVKESIKAKTSTLMILFGFIQMHVSYGIGSIWGVISAPCKFGLWPSKHAIGKPITDRIY